MKDWAALRARYQQDSLSIQLGGLASNLNRIAWHAEHGDRPAPSIFLESKYFTEWAAASCSLEQQGVLADVQRQLAVWERGWAHRVDGPTIAYEAHTWSTKLLKISGL